MIHKSKRKTCIVQSSAVVRYYVLLCLGCVILSQQSIASSGADYGPIILCSRGVHVYRRKAAVRKIRAVGFVCRLTQTYELTCTVVMRTPWH